MFTEKLERMMEIIDDNIDGIARARGTYEDVIAAIKDRKERPTEEQRIDKDVFGGDGVTTKKRIAGRTVVITKVHRAGPRSTDIKGADLLYDVPGNKYVLVQYKNAKNGRVTLDMEQLQTLVKACHVECPPSKKERCGSWYAVFGDKGGKYLPACEAMEKFGANKSCKEDAFFNGLSPSMFEKEFAKCNIGARVSLSKLEVMKFAMDALSHGRAFVHVVDYWNKIAK